MTDAVPKNITLDELAAMIAREFANVQKQFTEVHERLNRIELRLDKIEKRLDALEFNQKNHEHRIRQLENAREE